MSDKAHAHLHTLIIRGWLASLPPDSAKYRDATACAAQIRAHFKRMAALYGLDTAVIIQGLVSCELALGEDNGPSPDTNPVREAWAVLERAVQEDHDWGMSIFDNLSMAMQDSGITREQANKAASRQMQMLFHMKKECVRDKP